ncbi:cora-like Mg2+ transporter protein-domain-containing protein [Suillus paluster]|uniref:cora-like Mg2+ transporter protein-domain-containing protein n=1 Tax=Suillus paluster TaxID=48578 RepID=UPI001B872A20|nr:cora-like Mg2+ transporter protein-domain-containing protein [Suillus paluster]XP_041175691.1 cora-like Mg2+ transporter protein-domain-containing protein [Suillus paluster]KAG1718353.1 cora-like Mg2+ transporter protein-domain-containing protein [Suillus paluster]KAG1736644.1 cora-like Mg2+ transporter protein-domain-containing protein [Suillus paluster]
MDLESETALETEPVSPSRQSVEPPEWRGYPQSLFGNWVADRVSRCKMVENCSKESREKCRIYYVDVLDTGKFKSAKDTDPPIDVDERALSELWDQLQTEPTGLRLRVLLVDNMKHPVLQMLGTRYNIEPFFFTSSSNWIPSRYQEEVNKQKGDHITVTLLFVRTAPWEKTAASSQNKHISDGEGAIDTQESLPLRSVVSSVEKYLLQDLLALHMIRSSEPSGSTIISYHPSAHWKRTTAEQLKRLVHKVGESVYWQKIFEQSKDPTFVFLAILWYALYAWDESLDHLYTHINWLETNVLLTNDSHLTTELHTIQAQLFHYTSLLEDFRKSVNFVRSTPSPVLESHEFTEQARSDTHKLMQKECDNLLSEIDRLGFQLKNIIDLVYFISILDSTIVNFNVQAKATVNFVDSRRMQELTKATVRDSAAMKQISYLTMIFLPASFIASVFGMNVREIIGGATETIGHYAIVSVAFTVVTAWLVVAFQTHSPFHEQGTGFWRRLAWPFLYVTRPTGLRQSLRSQPIGDM